MMNAAAWSVFDTAAWLESHGRRYRAAADKALELCLDGRALPHMSEALWLSLLCPASGGPMLLSPAMAARLQASLAHYLLAHERQGLTPTMWNWHGVCGVGCCVKRLANRPHADVSATVRRLLQYPELHSIPMDVMCCLLQVLGMQRHSARAIAWHLPHIFGCFQVTERLIQSVSDYVIRAPPYPTAVMLAAWCPPPS